VLIFQPTVNCRASNNRSKQYQNRVMSAGKNAELGSVYVYIGVCGGV